MNCPHARFLLYAYLDRDVSGCEAEALSRHLAECTPCQARARSARGLARVLHSHVDRATAPQRLRARLQQGAPPAARVRAPVFAMAAGLLVLILPLVADVQVARSSQVSAAAMVPMALTASGSTGRPGAPPVARRMTGTLVCLPCEARLEGGLCAAPEKDHEPGLCAENGEVWRLMYRDPFFTQASAGQTVTLEGIAFPHSGFLRASRVGY